MILGECFVCGSKFKQNGKFCSGYCKRLVAIAIETKINEMDDQTLVNHFYSLGLSKAQIPNEVR